MGEGEVVVEGGELRVLCEDVGDVVRVKEGGSWWPSLVVGSGGEGVGVLGHE